jgi:hypothetical protein
MANIGRTGGGGQGIGCQPRIRVSDWQRRYESSEKSHFGASFHDVSAAMMSLLGFDLGLFFPEFPVKGRMPAQARFWLEWDVITRSVTASRAAPFGGIGQHEQVKAGEKLQGERDHR